MHIRKLILVLIAAPLLAGCSQPRTPVVLWTDVPEIVPVVELFNAAQERHVIELVYEAELGTALRLAETPPDLVIGTAIENAQIARLFSPLDRLLRREIDPSAIYPDLLRTGVRSGRHYLLPVSFNLPLVYFRSEIPEIDAPLVIGPDDIRSAGETFNTEAGERWTRLAYSPVWNPSFLYEYMRLQGFVVSETEDGAPRWPFGALVAGVSAARDWLGVHDGPEADLAFQDRYLYDPQVQLVRAGRVAYGYDTSDHYLGLSDARRNELGFRWFGTDGTIHVLDRIVYAGIPVGARSRDGAGEFLVNLFTLEHQVELVESSLRKRVDSFGVVGGFSSLRRMNETFMPRFYPELHGRIPPTGWLKFGSASPRHWETIVVEVVQPWLIREVIGSPQARDLEASVRGWLLQQED